MKPVVVFVDDDPNIRSGIKRVIRHQPYNILALASAQECVDVLAVTNVQVLITDLEMPGFNGKSLINYFRDKRPDVIRIVLSGKLDLSITLDLINTGGVFRCLEKPCVASTLLLAIDDALKLWTENSTRASISKNSEAKKSSQELLAQSNTTSLIRDALKDVERLEHALKEHSEQGRPLLIK